MVTTHRDVFQPLNRDIHANFPWHGLRNGTLTAITTSDIEYRNAVPPFCSVVYHEGIELRPHTEFLEKLYVLLTGVPGVSRADFENKCDVRASDCLGKILEKADRAI